MHEAQIHVHNLFTWCHFALYTKCFSLHNFSQFMYTSRIGWKSNQQHFGGRIWNLNDGNVPHGKSQCRGVLRGLQGCGPGIRIYGSRVDLWPLSSPRDQGTKCTPGLQGNGWPLWSGMCCFIYWCIYLYLVLFKFVNSIWLMISRISLKLIHVYSLSLSL